MDAQERVRWATRCPLERAKGNRAAGAAEQCRAEPGASLLTGPAAAAAAPPPSPSAHRARPPGRRRQGYFTQARFINDRAFLLEAVEAAGLPAGEAALVGVVGWGWGGVGGRGEQGQAGHQLPADVK